MERLTVFDGDKWDRATLKVKNQDLIDKLATYEDADEQGYLLWLPCKEGDTVYALDHYYECDCNYECEEMEQWKCEENIRCEHEYKVYRVKETNFQIAMLAILGKTVFLTKAEAEKVLEEMGK